MRIEQNIYGKNEGREGRMKGRERGGEGGSSSKKLWQERVV